MDVAAGTGTGAALAATALVGADLGRGSTGRAGKVGVMTPPMHPAGAPPSGRHERLVALLVLGVAVVVLLSSAAWFASAQVGAGIGQVLVGALFSAVGSFLFRQSRER